MNIEKSRDKNRDKNEKIDGVSPLSASVLTKDSISILFSSKTVLSGCGGDTSYVDADRLPKIHSDLVTDVSTIKSIMKETLVSDLHIRTGGIHIVGLFGPDGRYV